MGGYFSADSGYKIDELLMRIFWVCGSAKVIGIVTGAAILIYLRYQTTRAARGDEKAAQALILPVFQPVIILLMASLTVEVSLLCIHVYSGWDSSNVLTWALYEWIRDGFPMIFLQRSVSAIAFKRAAWLSLIPALHGAISGFLLNWFNAYGQLYYQLGSVFFHATIVKFFARRESILPYSYFMMIYRSMWIAYWLQNQEYIPPSTFYWPILAIIGLMEIPLTVLWFLILRSDTRYWRTGCSKIWIKKGHQNPLLDKKEVGLLTDTPDRVLTNDLQLMIETHHTKLIDFAFVAIDQRGLLGSGAFSRVYRGHYRGRPAAIKFFVKLAEVNADTINVYTKETAIAAAVSHDNIVHFHGLCVRPPTIFLIMELCSRGSLYGLLKKGAAHKWNLGRKLRMCLDACLGVQHLHKLGFIHRDLKSLNYLVTEDYRLKLTDFGLSRRIYTYTGSEEMALQNGEEAMVPALGADDTLTTRVGTSLWMSPEMMTGQPYNEKTDIYSLSLVLWEIMSGVPPYEEVASLDLHHHIVKDHRRPEMPHDCPPQLARLMQRGWSSDPFSRPSASEMVSTIGALLFDVEQSSVHAIDPQSLKLTSLSPSLPSSLPLPSATTVTTAPSSADGDSRHSNGSSSGDSGSPHTSGSAAAEISDGHTTNGTNGNTNGSHGNNDHGSGANSRSNSNNSHTSAGSGRGSGSSGNASAANSYDSRDSHYSSQSNGGIPSHHLSINAQ